MADHVDCCDLKALFGRDLKVTWTSERPGLSRDPWYREIRCRPRGTICPWGPTTLSFTATRRKRTIQRLIGLGCTLHSDGDQEQTVLFQFELLYDVAKLVNARKRRKLTEEQRARAKAVAEYNFSKFRRDQSEGQ